MSSAAPLCYYPKGNVAPDHTPCNESATQSWCCGPQAVCLSNGHCLQTTTDYANRIGRGSCTDRTWSSAACPFECADVRPDIDLALFLAYDDMSSPFCCQVPYDNATQSCPIPSRGESQPFQLQIGHIIYNRTDDSVMMNGTLPASALHRDTCDGQLNTSQPQTPTSTTCTQGCAQTCRSEPSNLATVAAGIAVPLRVLLLASLAALAVLFRQNRSLRRSASQPTPPMNSSPTTQDAMKHSAREMAHGMMLGHDGHNSNERALVESDGRSMVQELPARNLGN